MARQTRSGRIQAFVDLMDKPVVLAAREPESFQRILHYESELRDWFRVYPGWHLERNREMIRLVRTPSALREGLAPGGLKEPFDYLLFTLILHFAEVSAARGGDMFLLSLLAEELATLVQNRYGAGVLDFAEISHRRSLMRAMLLLEQLGALVRLDGSAGEWADGTAAADGLYAFTEVAYQIAGGPKAPEAERADDHPLKLPVVDGGDSEQRAWRTLLLGPALLAVDDPEAFALVERKHTFFGRELTDLFDWRLDIRQGMARILRESHAQDSGGVLISARLRSEYGPVLLFCNLLRHLVDGGSIRPDSSGCIRLPFSQFTTIVVDLRNEHRDLLAGGLSTCAPGELLERTLKLMRENGMLRGPDAYLDVLLTPLCALYRGIFAEEAPETETQDDSKGGASPEQLRLFT